MGVLPLYTSGGSTAVRAALGEVDVLLRVQTDDERGHVDELLADPAADMRWVSGDILEGWNCKLN